MKNMDLVAYQHSALMHILNVAHRSSSLSWPSGWAGCGADEGSWLANAAHQ